MIRDFLTNIWESLRRHDDDAMMRDDRASVEFTLEELYYMARCYEMGAQFVVLDGGRVVWMRPVKNDTGPDGDEPDL